jgi:hypothetical protein
MNPTAIKLLSSLIMMLGLMSCAFAASTGDSEGQKGDATITPPQPNVSMKKEENTTAPKEEIVTVQADVKTVGTKEVNTTIPSAPLLQPMKDNNATRAIPSKVEAGGESNATVAQPVATVHTTEVTHDETVTFVKDLQDALADQNYDRVEEILLKNRYLIDPETFHVSPYQAYRIGEIYYLKLNKKGEAKKFIQYAAQKGNADAVIFWDAYEIYKY